MTTDHPYRFMLIDDHPLIMEGIKNFLLTHDRAECMGEFTELRAALNSSYPGKPNVILLDLSLRLGDISGEAALPLLKKKFPEVKIIAFTQHKDQGKRLAEKGFDGYLTKEERELLIEAIHTVLNGGKYFKNIKKSGQPGSEAAATDAYSRVRSLTRRELEVAQYLAQAYSSREISKRIFISEATVDTHRKHIREKMDVRSKHEFYAILRSIDFNFLLGDTPSV